MDAAIEISNLTIDQSALDSITRSIRRLEIDREMQSFSPNEYAQKSIQNEMLKKGSQENFGS